MSDDFADAEELTLETPFPADSTGFTEEVDEPLPMGGEATAWYKFVAPYSGDFIVDTDGSAMDTILAVYSGTALNNLVELASNDDAPGLGVASLVNVTLVEGETYYIQVLGFGLGGPHVVTVHVGEGDEVAPPVQVCIVTCG